MKFKSNIELQAGLEDASGSPGTVNQLLSSTVTGTTWIDPSTIVAEAATVVVIACKNTSGATIAKGTPVYQTGTVGATATIEIAPADALISTGDLPAIGLLQTALNNNGFGFVVISGALTNFTTSPIDGVVPVTGDKVFLKSGGGLTLTKPTTSLNGIQNLGLIGKVAVGSAGTITVSSIMRTNDVPNLPEGRIWVGDGNTIVSDTVYVDEPNNRVGIGTISPDFKLDVAGDVRIENNSGLYFGGDTSTSFKWGMASVGLDLVINNSTTNGDVTFINDGNVGIGVTNPGAKLQVDGDGIFNGSVVINKNVETLRLGTTEASGGTYQTWHNASGRKGFFGYAATVNDIIYLVNDENSTIQLGTNGRVDDFIVSADGNIGLGITSPGVKLVTIAQNYSEGPTLGSGVVGGQALLSTNGLFGQYSGVSATTGHVWHQVQRNDVAVAFNMILQPEGGNVGIGTDSPGDKLVVQGDGDGILVRSNDFTLSRIIPRGSTSTNWDKALFSLYNAATESVRIDTAGNSWFNGGFVGIGNTAPSQLFHVENTQSGTWTTRFSNTVANSNNVYFGLNNGTTSYGMYIDGGQGAAGYDIQTASGFVVRGDGNVGIGTISPGANLEINDASSPKIRFGRDGSYYWDIGHTASDFQIQSQTGGTIMHLEYDGDVGIGTTSPTFKLHVNSTDASDNVAYIHHNNAAQSSGDVLKVRSDAGDNAGSALLNVANNTGSALYVRGDRNVGIGTTSPSYKLDVSGNGRFTSTVTATNFILSSDERLKTNIKEIETNHIDVNWKNFELKSEPGVKRAGVIAQELEEKHPEFVRTDDEGMKSVAYIDLLIAKIAELEARLEKAGI